MTISRKHKLSQIADYVKNKIENGNYPSHKDLIQKFTTIGYYKIHLNEIYSSLETNMLEIPIHKSKYCRILLKKGFIDYLKKEVSKGHYPTRRYLERKFKTNIIPMFKSISDLYSQAGVNYKQENSQELKNKKAILLTKIVLSILPKLGLEVLEVRGVHNKGVDIVTSNYQGDIVGIEIKAHNKYEPIKRRNIQQLLQFLNKEKLSKVILITTTSKFENNLEISNDIEIMDYLKLKVLCHHSQLEDINYIRNTSVHQESSERLIKKQKIISYARKAIETGEDITYNKISKDLNLHAYTYFDTINDVYIQADLLPPLGKIKGIRGKRSGKYYELAISKILGYMREEMTKGHYPRSSDIGQKFGVKHIWNFVTMTELYKRLGLNPYKSKNYRFKEIKQII